MIPSRKLQQRQRVQTPAGPVTLCSFCTAEQIRNCLFHDEFAGHAQYKSLYTRKESLEQDAQKPEANVVLALVDDSTIIGFGVLAYPEPGERWLELGPGRMIEVRVIEVIRSRRSDHIASALLRMLLTHPDIEEKITYMVGYSWTWDLDGTGLKAQAYRQLLIRLFSVCGFEEFETNEPNICLKLENLFMGRIGRHVPLDLIEQFNWLRFGLPPDPAIRSVDIGRPTPEPSHYTLFQPLIYENLTFLGIYHDWKSNRWTCRAAREWDDDIEWRRYNHAFTLEHPLTGAAVHLGHAQTCELFQRHGLHEYFDKVVGWIKRRRHMAIECFLEQRRDIRILHFLHSNTLGRNNICHAKHSGGICVYSSDRPEEQVIHEGLNLSRAMSFKNAGAQLPFGGARVAVRTGSLSVGDHDALGFLAYALDRTRSVVGPDMGFAPELVDVIQREGLSLNITGGFDSRLGPPGAATAHGVYLAIKEAAYFKYGSMNLAGRKIVVQGLGAVGWPLVEKYLSKEEALLYVADVADAPIERLAARLPDRIQILSPDEVLTFKGDILVPCAHGGVIGDSQIPLLGCSVIVGGANNTLAADTQQEEIRLAGLLAQQDILYLIDWLHNTAGFIGGAEEYLNRRKESSRRVIAQVEKVCRDGVRANLLAARDNGVTPTAQAYRHYNQIIYG